MRQISGGVWLSRVAAVERTASWDSVIKFACLYVIIGVSLVQSSTVDAIKCVQIVF